MAGESEFLRGRHERLDLELNSLRVEGKLAERVVGGNHSVCALDITEMTAVVDRQLKRIPAMRNHIGGFEGRRPKVVGVELTQMPGNP